MGTDTTPGSRRTASALSTSALLLTAAGLLTLGAVLVVVTGQAPWRHSAQLDPVARFLPALACTLICAFLGGKAAALFRQPPVIGEICAGILLGPTLLGRWAPSAEHWLFPKTVQPMLAGIAQLGLVLFMFTVGQDLAARPRRRPARETVWMSAASMLLPFTAACAVAPLLVDSYLGTSGSRLAFTLFLGCALSITAFPVLARIIVDLGLSRTPAARLSLSVASVGDAAAWVVLAAALAFSARSGATNLIGTGLQAVVFVVLLLGPGRL